jgi:hypothetical protein
MDFCFLLYFKTQRTWQITEHKTKKNKPHYQDLELDISNQLKYLMVQKSVQNVMQKNQHQTTSFDI